MASQFLQIKRSLPQLGVGLGLRRELAEDTFANAEKIDFLELVPENYMDQGGAARGRLDEAISQFPLVTHGINLSVGSTDELNQNYLKSIKRLLADIKAPWWSDHLCFTSIGGIYMHDLLPLPFSREAVKHCVERIKKIQAAVEVPFLVENISFYMHLPGCELTDAQFLSEILEQSDCGLLLDINNVYVNSLNHKFDPYEYLNQIPLERTVQMHIAGHKRTDDYVIDTHGASVVKPVYDLLEHTLKRVDVKAILLERDQNFPAMPELIAELDVIRSIADKAQPALNARQQQTAPQSNVAGS